MSVPARVSSWIALCALLCSLLQFAPLSAGARNKVTFSFDDGVSAEDRNFLKEGTRLAQDYLERLFGFEVAAPVTVSVLESDGVAGQAGGYSIVYHTGSQVWSTTSPVQKLKIAVHEYVHVLQQELWRQGRPYTWMIEGTAELLSYQAVIDLGLISAEEVVAMHEYNLVHSSERPALMETESDVPQNAGTVYSMWYLAARMLTEASGLIPIATYFQLVGDGTDSKSALERAFGVSLAEFYEQYDSYEAQVTAPGNASGRLFPPGELNDYSADLSIGIATREVKAGDQAVWLGYTAANVRCSMELVAPDGESLLTYRTRSDRLGVVFWLFTVYARTPEGTATVNATCGSNTISTELLVTPAN